VIGHGWLLAEAVQEVFVRKTGRLSPEIGSVSIRTKRDQISGKALPALHAMANKGHKKTQLQSCLLTNVRERSETESPTAEALRQCWLAKLCLLRPHWFAARRQRRSND